MILINLKKNWIPIQRLGLAPPHGGSAPGIDRMIMLLADERILERLL